MEQAKKLYRSQKDRVIAGICAGLGEYFNLDPVIFRILFVLFALSGGAGALVYLVLIFVIPTESDSIKTEGQAIVSDTVIEKTPEAKTVIQKTSRDRWNFVAVLLIIIGLIALGNEFFPMHWFRWGIAWSIAVIFFGLYLIFKKG